MWTTDKKKVKKKEKVGTGSGEWSTRSTPKPLPSAWIRKNLRNGVLYTTDGGHVVRPTAVALCSINATIVAVNTLNRTDEIGKTKNWQYQNGVLALNWNETASEWWINESSSLHPLLNGIQSHLITKKPVPAMNKVLAGQMILIQSESGEFYGCGTWTSHLSQATIHTDLASAKSDAQYLEDEYGDDVDVVLNYGRKSERIASPAPSESCHFPDPKKHTPPPLQCLTVTGKYYLTRNGSVLLKTGYAQFKLVEKGGDYDVSDSTRTRSMETDRLYTYLPIINGYDKGGCYGSQMDIEREYYGYSNTEQSSAKRKPTVSKGSKVAVTNNMDYTVSKKKLLLGRMRKKE
jgi:hypothetical protein